jgi:hypothetical protein
MTSAQLPQLLAMNRTEELGYDVWNEFVIPPYYPKLSVGNTRKPQVIIGGRGCGKTMLLRYLSHESTFSKKRPSVPQDALRHVGLYWRADTQFASLMQRRGLEDDTWAAAFRHLAAVVLGIEILRSLKSIAGSALDLVSEDDLASLDFRRLQPFSSDLPSLFPNLYDFLEDRLAEFESWANDVRAVSQPRFLPGSDFLKRMIQVIRQQVAALNEIVFFVYIDEYENLTVQQQKIVNTWLKHSEPPLVFNVAMKRNGFKTQSTEGAEALSDIHDYRDVDIEQFDVDSEFPVFAAEIFLLRLRLAELPIGEIDPDRLRDPSTLSIRQESAYVDRVLATVHGIFPSRTHCELAKDVFCDGVLKQRLFDRVGKALQDRGEAAGAVADYLSSEYPEASVIMPALLQRRSLSTTEIKREFSQLKSGKENRFTGPTDWIHNNFIGCYLQLFEGLVRACPLYSGFRTFCLMSRGNLRHFLELSFQTLGRFQSKGGGVDRVDVERQAYAARQVSADLLAEVRSFGPQGNNLHTFVLRLGSLFSLAQQRPTQSEPERTHFSIQGGESELDENQVAFLSEAIKWSVLFGERETKKKSSSEPEGSEFVLNPIYAPYFHISYRKKRKLELSVREAAVLISGAYDEVRALLKGYQTRWSVNLSEASLPLFAHLDEDEGK